MMQGAQPAAVVSTMSSSGLAIVRSLGRRGVTVYAVDPAAGDAGLRSRYCTPRTCPPLADEDAYTAFLVSLGRSLAAPAVLYPTGDRTVLLFSERRAALAPYFRLLLPEHGLVQRLVSKNGLDGLAREHGVAAPRTVMPADAREAHALAGELHYPVLLKPAISPSWNHPAIRTIVGDNSKVVVARSPGELLGAYERIAAVDARLVVQELVPGDDDQLYYVCMYCDQHAEPLAGFAGRKERLFPVHFGSATYVRTVHDPALLELARDVARRFGYRGLCGIEFKLDPRDGRYKLIEFNARFGLWDQLGAELGIDLAHLAYLDATGQPVPRRWDYPAGVSWVGLRRDFAAVRTYRREGAALSWPAWLWSVSRTSSHALFSFDDPWPSVHSTLDFARSTLRRLVGRGAAGATEAA